MNGFFQTPVVYSGNDDLPVIPESDIQRYEAPFEVDAYDHWALNGADSSLVGLVNSHVLDKVGTTIADSGTFSMTVNTSVKNGLRSDKIDSRVQTQCAVIRVNALPTNSSAVAMLMGAFGTSVGSGVFIDNTNTLRRNFRPSVSVVDEISVVGLDNKWLFIAFSENGTASTMSSTLMLGGDTPSLLTRATGAKSASSLGIGVGQVDYSAPGTSGIVLNVAEYIVYERALSDAELLAVYGRSKKRLADRGFVIE